MSEALKILVSLPVNEAQKERILGAAGEAEIVFAPQNEVTEEMLAKARVVFGNLPAELLKKAPHLQWLQLNSAGADAYVKPGALASSVQLTNAVGAYGLAVSEHMLALLFAMNRRLMEYDKNQQKSLWKILKIFLLIVKISIILRWMVFFIVKIKQC